jgi:hypothetical protein
MVAWLDTISAAMPLKAVATGIDGGPLLDRVVKVDLLLGNARRVCRKS